MTRAFSRLPHAPASRQPLSYAVSHGSTVLKGLIISVPPEGMHFSHPDDDRDRTITPIRPMTHENLFREPEPVSAPRRREITATPQTTTRHTAA